MGQNVYSIRGHWGASGTERGSGTPPKPKTTVLKGLVQKIESHTPRQFILCVSTQEGEKRLKIGEANLLGLEKGKTYLFSCRPNVGVGDGSTAQWAVTKKPEIAASSGLKPRQR